MLSFCRKISRPYFGPSGPLRTISGSLLSPFGHFGSILGPFGLLGTPISCFSSPKWVVARGLSGSLWDQTPIISSRARGSEMDKLGTLRNRDFWVFQKVRFSYEPPLKWSKSAIFSIDSHRNREMANGPEGYLLINPLRPFWHCWMTEHFGPRNDQKVDDHHFWRSRSGPRHSWADGPNRVSHNIDPISTCLWNRNSEYGVGVHLH